MNNGEIFTLNYRFVSFSGTQMECCEHCCMGESPFACCCPPDIPECVGGYYIKREADTSLVKTKSVTNTLENRISILEKKFDCFLKTERNKYQKGE